MTDREKVIKWLECCGNYDEHLNHIGCTEKCPYYANELCCDPVAPFQDALKLLKEQPELVRCKDCTAWKQYGGLNLGKCELFPEYNKMGNWFCNFGERKET